MLFQITPAVFYCESPEFQETGKPVFRLDREILNCRQA